MPQPKLVLFLFLFFLTLPNFHSFGEPGCVPALARVARRDTTKLVPPAEVVRLAPSDTSAEGRKEFLSRTEYGMGTYNVENLFLSVGSYKPDPVTGERIQVRPSDVKPPWQRAGVAQAVSQTGNDVNFLQEVELNAGEQFIRKDLNGTYSQLESRGNDFRGIDVVDLIKNRNVLDFTYESHKNEPWTHPLYPKETKVFSRDATALVARLPPYPKPLYVAINTHGKSKRTDIHADPDSNLRRLAQAERLADLAQYYMDLYDCPVIIAGDFNDEINTASTYLPLREMGFKDAFDLTPGPRIPAGDPRRVTHTYHPFGKPTQKHQLDAIMVSPNAHDIVLGAEVQSYVDEHGKVMPVANTFQARKKQPSDHWPVNVRFDLQKMLKRIGAIAQ